MPNDTLTTTQADGFRFQIQRTDSAHGALGPVVFATSTGGASFHAFFEVDEARALIAALQLVVDDVEREGQEKFDRHVEGKLAGKKFIDVPVSAGVRADV